jgi:hypothetical protein
MNPTPLARNNVAISLSKGLRQRASVWWRKPQAEEVSLQLRLLKVHILSPGMNNLMVVEELNVSWLKHHVKPDVLAGRELLLCRLNKSKK